jgi:hypothetical protein
MMDKVLNVRPFRKSDFNTDHFLVMAKLRERISKIK